MKLRSIAYILCLPLVIAFCSCNKSQEQSEIPDVHFTPLRIEMLKYPYSLLRGYGQFIEIDTRENGYPIGYAGIIVGKSTFPDMDNNDQYFAYDRACQVEGARKSPVNVIEGTGTAECPECHARYDLNNYGIPISGSRIALKRYRVIQQGADVLYVYSD